MDLSLTIIALDRGAANILDYRGNPSSNPNSAYEIPEQIRNAVRSHDFTDISCLRMSLRFGLNEYDCRAYLIESREEFLPQPTVAFLLENHALATDAIDSVAAHYHLTRREQEALRGISMGLSSIDVAKRMNISPSTLRTFLRLMKIKMGTTSRAGMVSKILQNRVTPVTPSPVSSMTNGHSN